MLEGDHGVGFVLDIGERKRFEAEVRASEARYRHLFETMDEGFFVIDILRDEAGQALDARYLEHNAAARRLTGTPIEGGRTAREVLPNLDPRWIDRYAEVARSGVPMRTEDYDPALDRWFDVYAAPARDGHADRVVVVFSDTTPRRKAEAALRDSEARAAQAQRLEALGRFAGGIAHDFNNLLTAVVGYTEILERAVGDAKLRAHLARIRDAADRGAALTRQILGFARPQVGQVRAVDLDATVRAVDPILRRLIGADIELVTVPNAGGWSVRADPVQVEQVLFNLVVNARDAMPDGGRVVIETRAIPGEPSAAEERERAARVRLTVQDTGVGMDAETLAHCFEPFFTTKGPEQGTGLGLATVWSIVEHAGGDVRVDSSPGQGTRFEIELARAEPSEGSAAAAPADPAEPVRGGDETILVAEDEPTLRELAVSTLEALGYRVHAATNGAEAVELVAGLESPVDAVVTDMVMPLMNGRELVRRLRQDRPDLPVLYVSGYPEQAVDPNDAFLPKPFSPSDLARRVRAVLDRARPG
jgi:two-component system cell cycle sensor histidine kinase/response regulator CckA